MLQIVEDGLSMRVDADFDGAGALCRLFPWVYLGHPSTSHLARIKLGDFGSARMRASQRH